jgi:hypothetical protein
MDLATVRPQARHDRPAWSPEARVLLRPSAAFRELPRDGNGLALLALRPLLFALFFGFAVSALVSGTFTVRLILDGAISFAFVPAIHVGALAIPYRMARSVDLSFARAVDLFFTGNGAWLLWMIVVTVIGAVIPPRQIGPWLLPLLAGFLVPLFWSLWIDFHFFRSVMNQSVGGALRHLALQRAIAWVGVTIYFLGNSMVPFEQALRP